MDTERELIEADRAAEAGRVLADLSRSLAEQLGSRNPWSRQFLQHADEWAVWSEGLAGRDESPPLGRFRLRVVR